MAATRPCSSHSAREQNFATDPRSWLTKTIVFPSSRNRRTSRSTSPGTRVADGEHLVEQQHVERRPGSRSSTRAGPACRTSSSSASGRRTARARRTRRSRRSAPRAPLRVSPSSVPLMRTLSRALSSGLKPTPSSMNGDSRPLTRDGARVLPVDAGDDLEQRALAASVGADDAEELAPLDAKLTSSSACCRSYVVRSNGWRKCSLNVVRCSWGSRNAFETPIDLDRAAGRQTRSAKHGSSRRKSEKPTTKSPSAIAIGTARPPCRGLRGGDRVCGEIGYSTSARMSWSTCVNGLRKAISRPGRQEADRVDDRRGVEEQLQPELPDLTDVAKADEQRREDERDADDEDVELEHEQRDQQPVELRA